jgi:Leucine-rich repeat (LRR) protein
MEELDLHWTNEDPDFGIASEGILCKDMNDITNRINKVKNTVKKINLDNQQSLKAIPEVFHECKLLEELNISHTNIKNIPDFLFTLPKLRFLSCRCSELEKFPSGIAGAANLEKLHFRINKEWAFPEEICSLQNLKSFSADFYCPAPLPKKAGNLKKLESMNLFLKYEENNIPVFPDSFKGHPSLKKLSINDRLHKKIKNFDLEHTIQILSSCANFEALKLDNIAVGGGYKNLSSLSGLKELELRNLIVEGNILKSITGLNKLEVLQIWGSNFNITELPDMFSGMKDLRIFSFADNMISSLPPSIYSLENLKTLEIGSTGISAVDEKIGNLKQLENIQVYNNILEKLPQAIFTLPCLNFLNIEENSFKEKEIEAITASLKELEAKGQKVQFIHEGQGHLEKQKKLRILKNIDKMDVMTYAKLCLSAIKEYPHSIRYVNDKKLQGTKFYAELCTVAVRKSPLTLVEIEPKTLGKPSYFLLCMEAAKNSEIGGAFKFINKDSLDDFEYIQVSLEAALHNKAPDFINNFNNDAFAKRFNRKVYEKICWVSVLHNPATISKVIDPTPGIKMLAEKHHK